jgi:transcriptional antiterminator NusG
MTMALLKIGDFVEPVDVAPKVKPEPKHWYLLRVHPNRELTIEQKLTDRGVSVYVPKEKRTVPTVWSRRALRTVPIFPGMILIPDFEANLRKLRSLADGIIGYVTFGDCVAIARPEAMDIIRNIEASFDLSPSQRKRKYAVDQQVRVVNGAFEWMEGRIQRLDSHGRLKVLLHIMEREVLVELDEDQIGPV